MTRIRAATDADAPAVRALQTLLERSNPDLLERHLNGLGAVLVAERDGAVVGYVAGFLAPDRTHATEVAVAPAHRRRGIGSDLLDAFCDRAAAAGARRVTLAVAPDNEGARRCYRDLGFEPIGTDETYFGETPAVLMARDLAERTE